MIEAKPETDVVLILSLSLSLHNHGRYSLAVVILSPPRRRKDLLFASFVWSITLP
jgi:hypothetical protein